jgi:hypothetical protein
MIQADRHLSKAPARNSWNGSNILPEGGLFIYYMDLSLQSQQLIGTINCQPLRCCYAVLQHANSGSVELGKSICAYGTLWAIICYEAMIALVIFCCWMVIRGLPRLNP